MGENRSELWAGLGMAAIFLAIMLGFGGCSMMMSLGAAAQQSATCGAAALQGSSHD